MRTGALEVASALLLLLWVGPALAQAPTRAGQPQVKVGDASVVQERNVLTGETKETRFRLIGLDASKIVLETGGSTSGTQTFSRDWNLLEVKTGEVVAETFKPFRPVLQFPLQVGGSWSMPFEVEARDRSGRRHAQWQWSARVVSVEPVTVPAGTFQAFRIEYEGTFTTREKDQTWSGSHKETAWYAPTVNRIVKRDFEQVVPSRGFVEHHVLEMLSFTPAK